MANLMASAVSERGELTLLRREDDALELRVNGIFVMDTLETSSERLLAAAALTLLESPAENATDKRAQLRVLIGGLGLGFTLAEVLSHPRVAAVTVAEIEPALAEWHSAGLVPDTISATTDTRVRLEVDDVRVVLETQPGASLDLVLLDVDNGPGQLVYDANASLYEDRFLQLCHSRLSNGGVLAVWSSESAPALEAELRAVFGNVDHRLLAVTLGRRKTTYSLYLSRSGLLSNHAGSPDDPARCRRA